MYLQVINPNTSPAMTAKIGDAARAVAAPGTDLLVCQPEDGPVSIEGHFDDAIAAVGVLEEMRKGILAGCQGHIIACFGDPGLNAARELATGPVIGIAEAAFHMATLISTRFSVVTTMTRTRIIAEELLHRYGFAGHCARVRATDLPVLALETPDKDRCKVIFDEARQARDRDGIGAIVLGCGGMTDLADALSDELGIPVVDGVRAAVKLAESLVSLRLGTSKHGDLALPLPKVFKGRFKDWGSSE